MLSKTEYESIYQQPYTMYELFFDYGLVTMNRTLKTVMHTVTNATDCFQEAKLHYITNQYIRVDVSPLQCTIPIDSTL